MQCDIFNPCPTLYTCQKFCIHQPLLTWTFNLFAAILLIPILSAISNKVGFTSTWLKYVVFIIVLSYYPQDTWAMISAVALGASLISIIFKIREVKDQTSENSFHFHYIEVCMIPLIVGTNLGIKIAQLEPFILTTAFGIILGIFCLIYFISLFKQIRADQKIAVGAFKKLLPPRYLSPKKQTKVQFLMSSIQQVDSDVDSRFQGMRYSQISKKRQQLLTSKQKQSVWKHITLIIIIFIIYESLCLGFNLILEAFGVNNQLILFLVSLFCITLIMVAGQFFLYKIAFQQKILSQKIYSVKLGIDMNTEQFIKLSILSLLGGLLQGIVGFGFCQLLLLFMTASRLSLFSSIASNCILSIFIAIIFVANSLFCQSFEIYSFLEIFGYTLLSTPLIQYLLERWLSEQDNKTLGSNLLILMITTMSIIALCILLSLGFMHFRFGPHSYLQLGEYYIC